MNLSRIFDQSVKTSKMTLKKSIFVIFLFLPMFSYQNVDQSYIMRQQAITLIFLVVIEDIKTYITQNNQTFLLFKEVKHFLHNSVRAKPS
jgi:hypothetical protein